MYHLDKIQFICLLLMGTFWVNTSNSAFAKSTRQLTNWEYAEGDLDMSQDLSSQLSQKTWIKVEGTYKPAVSTSKVKNIWMRSTLGKIGGDYILFIKAIDQDYEVYVDGKLWHKYGVMGDNGVGAFHDWRPHFIPLSSQLSNKTIYFRIYSDHSSIGFTGTPVVGDKNEVFLTLLKSELPRIFIVMSLIVVSIVCVFIVIGGGQTWLFISAALISVFGGLYLFTKTLFPYVVFPNQNWFNLEIISLSLIPCFYSLFLGGLSKGTTKNIFIGLFLLNMFLSLLAVGYSASKYLELRTLIIPIQVFIVATLLFSFWVAKFGNIEGKNSFKLVFLGTVVAGSGIIWDVIVAVNLFTSNVQLGYYSGFILFFSMSIAAGMDFKEQFIISRKLQKEKIKSSEKIFKEKMEVVSTLAGGMAVEINAPLKLIKESAEGLALKIQKLAGEKNSSSNPYVEKIDAAVFRVNNVIQSLLILSKDSVEYKMEVPLSVVLVSAIEKAKSYAVEKKIQFKNDLIPNDIYIYCVLDNMTEALLGVMMNAVEAASKNEEKWVSVNIERHINGVTIYVKDSGLGIPQHKLKRIFEPFYSTKYEGEEGAGLGLAIAHKIIQTNGGKLWVNETEANTTFVISLPSMEFQSNEHNTRDERIVKGITDSSL